MRGRIRDWVATIFFVPIFFATLCLFQPFLMVARPISLKLFFHILELMNWCIIWNIKYVARTTFEMTVPESLPVDRPCIVVANHQSMYDIPMFICFMRRLRPRFIAKVELAKWIPSISYALRVMGGALIIRSDQQQASNAIKELGERANREKMTVVIFPEGTRARGGSLKRFKGLGFSTLCKAMPDAVVLPVVITNSWKLLSHQLMPIPTGTTVTFKVLEPIELKGKEPKTLLPVLRDIIQTAGALPDERAEKEL